MSKPNVKSVAYSVGKVLGAIGAAKLGQAKAYHSKSLYKKPLKPMRKATYTKSKGRTGLARSQNLNTIGEPAMVYATGRARKIRPAFREKVIKAISSSNTQFVKLSGASITTANQCNYIVPTIMGDPVHYSTMSKNINGYSSNVNSTLRFEQQNATLSHTLSNPTTGVLFCRVYECEPRGDVPYMTTIYTSIQSIIVNSDSDVGYAALDNDPTGTLFQNSLFVSLFKINRVRMLQMQPGEQKQVKLIDRRSHPINMERLNPSGATSGVQTYIGFRLLTKFFVYQFWGSQADAAASDTTGIEIAPTKLDWRSDIKYDYKWAQDYSTNVYSTGAYGTTTTPTFINEISGLPATGPSFA